VVSLQTAVHHRGFVVADGSAGRQIQEQIESRAPLADKGVGSSADDFNAVAVVIMALLRYGSGTLMWELRS
jgi:hypothetical protein